MKRHIPGLHSWQPDDQNLLEGLFLVRVDRAHFRWQPKKSYLELRFVVLEPIAAEKKFFYGRLYTTEKALWKFSWFLRDFGYDAELFSHEQVDVRKLLNLQGVVRISHSVINGRTCQNLDAFAPAGEWETLSSTTASVTSGKGSHP
ncbi:MAG TPA: hypothetical protein VMI32_11455 [Candidatus Solibacter sp.]|nr:hypothetical protein [Candidatus Solibacter sp.]